MELERAGNGSTVATAFCALAACLLAGCGQSNATHAAVEPRGEAFSKATPEAPLPSIPAALRGCWVLDDPEYPENHDRLTVTASGLMLGGREATADYINSVTEDSTDGRFAAPENSTRMTIATSLEISEGGDGAQAGQLILREGDAGSHYYSRCNP